MRLVWGTVVAVEGEYADVQRLAVELDTGVSGTAVSYTRLSGACVAHERVLLNTTAVDLALGTGGSHFVLARAGTGGGVVHDVPSGGHIMKLRYTPLQTDVLSVESQESPFHDVMRTAVSLQEMPVVCCGLHSQVPLVAAAVKHRAPELRVAFCMIDQAALAMGLSDVIRASTAAGLVDETVTCGQAFGGGLEAVNLHSGLLAARHVARADVAIVAIGPGVVGTATPFGHGGVVQGEALNAVAALDGSPIACLRVSFADARARHRGVSHHSIAALTRIALARCTVALPSVPAELLDVIDGMLAEAGVWDAHERVLSDAGSVPPPPMRGVEVTTMGRGLEDDPAFFAAAFAAGEVAASRAVHSG